MMNKEDKSKTRFCVQWDAHSKFLCTVLCSLMEHQSLVDLAICCGSNTIHAHKCILAANSPYFREQLEKNATAEQVIINGLDFIIIKSIIEFIYCGETNISDENMKYMIAAAKFFQIRGLQALEQPDMSEDHLHIPPPIFINKKPKYPTALRPFNNVSMMGHGLNKNFLAHEPYNQRKIKRKHIRSEAERACAKEAAASRLALEALRKELATAPQVNSFVIEESCTETTVENFIPHSEENFIENLNEIQGVQVVNYADLNNGVYTPSGHIVNVDKPFNANSLLHYNIPTSSQMQQDAPVEKIKHILGSDIPNNVEIMFKTSDGNFVSVTDEVLQNITKGALQYQVIDENGHAGEIQELHVLDKTVIEPSVSESGGRSELSGSTYDETFSSYVNDDSKLLLSSLSDASGITNNDSGIVDKERNKNLNEPLLNLYDNEGLYFNLKTNENSGEVELQEVTSKKPSRNSPSDNYVTENTCFVDLVNDASLDSMDVENKPMFKDVSITDCGSVGFNSDLPALISCAEPDLVEESPGKMMKLRESAAVNLSFSEESFQSDMMVNLGGSEFSPRKTRSNFKIGPSLEVLDADVLEFKKEKVKRVMPNRKKK